MKTNRVFLAAAAMTAMAPAAAMARALDDDAAMRRVEIDPPEPPRYGPGTGTVPPEFEPTERDKARMAAAEEKRARRRARNLVIASKQKS